MGWRSSIRVLAIGLVLLTIGNSATADDRPKPIIHWMVTGLPPKMIPEGPLRGTGYGEQQVAILARRLPQFDQRLEIVTPPRLWHEMQTGRGVCSINIADLPDRETWAVFTRRHAIGQDYEVLVRQDRVPEFAEFRGADGAVDLDRLAASDRLTGIYVSERYYGLPIIGFIKDPARRTRLEPILTATKIYEMIASGRRDFSFGADAEMNYFKALDAATPNGKKHWPALALLKVKGGGEPVSGQIACSREPLGQRMVEALDGLFDDESAWDEFLAPQKSWLRSASP